MSEPIPQYDTKDVPKWAPSDLANIDVWNGHQLVPYASVDADFKVSDDGADIYVHYHVKQPADQGQ